MRIVDEADRNGSGVSWTFEELSIAWIIMLCWFEGACDSRRRWATDASIGEARRVFAAYTSLGERNES